MRQVKFLILFLAVITSFVTGSVSNNYFTNPASINGVHPVFTLGDKLVISWKTTLDVFSISLWQQDLLEEAADTQGNIYSKIESTEQVTNFTWVVQLYGFDLSYSNVFFLWVNPAEPDSFSSTYFNITEPASATSTVSSSTSISASASMNTPDRAIKTSSPSSSSSPSDSASQKSELSTTGKIAIGIGIGVGVPVVCALGALLWLKTRRYHDKSDKIISPPEILPPLMVMQNQPAPPASPKEAHGASLTRFSELPQQPYR